MDRETVAILLLVMSSASCRSTRAADGAQPDAPPAVQPRNPAEIQDRDSLETVLATSGRDSVVTVLRPGPPVRMFRSVRRLMIWFANSGTRFTKWTSNLGMAGPGVILADVNGDSRMDLFYATEFEQAVGGELVLGTDSTGLQVFVESGVSCGRPELKDINADGRLELLEYESGALTPDECWTNEGAQCRSRFPTDWVIVSEVIGFEIRRYPREARQFYIERAAQYATAAAQLRDLSRDAPFTNPCPSSLPAALDSLSFEATAIARRG